MLQDSMSGDSMTGDATNSVAYIKNKEAIYFKYT